MNEAEPVPPEVTRPLVLKPSSQIEERMGKKIACLVILPIAMITAIFLCGVTFAVSAEETAPGSGTETAASSAAASETNTAYQKELMEKFNSLIEGKDLHMRYGCQPSKERCEALSKALMDGNFTFITSLPDNDPMTVQLNKTCAHVKPFSVAEEMDHGQVVASYYPQGPLTWYRVPFAESRQSYGRDIYILRAEDYAEELDGQKKWYFDGLFFIFSPKHCHTIVPGGQFFKYVSGTQHWHDLPVKPEWMSEPILIGSRLYLLSVYAAQDQGKPEALDIYLRSTKLDGPPLEQFNFTTEKE